MIARTIMTYDYSLSNKYMFHVKDLTADYTVTMSGTHLTMVIQHYNWRSHY